MNVIKTTTKMFQKLDERPIVVLSVEDYERMCEDLEMYRSLNYKKSVKKAREEVKNKKVYSLSEVKKKLKLT